MKPVETSPNPTDPSAKVLASLEETPVEILLVDDDPRNLDVLEGVLEMPGYTLVRAGSANDALLALVSGDFAVIVLDIRMHDLSGFELANLIKQRRRTRHIPIIFLTAYYADEKFALEGYGAGAVDYLTKPVNPTVLRLKVAVFVELHRKSLALAETNRQLQLEVAQRQRSEELLRVANAELEVRVSQRTAELGTANAALRGSEQRLRQLTQQLEQKVKDRTVSLTEAIAQMEEFSYTVSHDLRAPLRALNTYSEALLQDYGPQLDDRAKDYIGRIQRSSLRMEKLTHDLLTYSRLARSEVKLEKVNLDALVHDLIEQYEDFQPPRSSIEVVEPLGCVVAHEAALGQSIANLLANAVKFVAEGVQPRIRIFTEPRDAFLRLWIEDNGIGIEPRYHGRIFEVFERLHGSEHYEGTGMGLAIVRKVMEKTGGHCGVESTGSQGSRFWLELPVS